MNQARKLPETFFIGIDSNAENLDCNSRKTSFFSKKKGLENILFVQANIENLPPELLGLASKITVLLPWGSLLRAVAKPDLLLLNEIRKLCYEKATIIAVFGYDCATERKLIEELGLSELTPSSLDMCLRLYSEVGFRSLGWRCLSQEELKIIPSKWAKKLAHGKKRQFVEIFGISS